MRIPLPRRALRSISIILFIILGPYLFLRRLSAISLANYRDDDELESNRQAFLSKIKVSRQGKFEDGAATGGGGNPIAGGVDGERYGRDYDYDMPTPHVPPSREGSGGMGGIGMGLGLGIGKGLGLSNMFGVASSFKAKKRNPDTDVQKILASPNGNNGDRASGADTSKSKSRAKKPKSKSKSKPKRPKGPQHTYLANGLLIPNVLAQHPIWDLLERSKANWEDKLDRASTTLAEAVDEYRRRYGRSPPKGFDRWWVSFYIFASGDNSRCLRLFSTD